MTTSIWNNTLFRLLVVVTLAASLALVLNRAERAAATSEHQVAQDISLKDAPMQEGRSASWLPALR